MNMCIGNPRRDRKSRPHRTGIALIIVLVVIVLITFSAYSFTELMVSHQYGTVMHGRQIQARAAVSSGVEYLKDYLALDADSQAELGGSFDNPSYFQDVLVADLPTGSYRFSIFSVVQDANGDSVGIRYGLDDQGSRLNVNQLVTSDRYKQSGAGGASSRTSTMTGTSTTSGVGAGGNNGPSAGSSAGSLTGGTNSALGNTGSGGTGNSPAGTGTGGNTTGGAGTNPSGANSGNSTASSGSPSATSGSPGGGTPAAGSDESLARNALMALPGMTESIADSILDWIDSDDIPRTYGVESDFYRGLGYEAANQPIQTLDELLLVQGVTPELLFGGDRNRNGLLDAGEQVAISSMSSATGGAGSMTRGWSAYLAASSKDEPQPRLVTPIDLNQDDLQALYDEVEKAYNADTATFIVAYRQGGPYLSPQAQAAQAAANAAATGLNGSGSTTAGLTGTSGTSNPPGGSATAGAGTGGGAPSGGVSGGASPGGAASGGAASGNGATTADGGPPIEAINGRTVNLTTQGPNKFTSVLDLIGSETLAQFPAPPSANGQNQGGNQGGNQNNGGQGSGGQGSGNQNNGRNDDDGDDRDPSGNNGSSGESNRGTGQSDGGSNGGQGANGQNNGGQNSGGQNNGGQGNNGQQQPQTVAVRIASPFANAGLDSLLPELMETFTTGEAAGEGRINVNRATGAVLGSLPGLEPGTASSIAAAQDSSGASGDDNYLYPTWPLARGLVTLDEMKKYLPFLTVSGKVYRAQIVGYSDDPGAFARAEVVIDTSGGSVKVLLWRDLSHLGPGIETSTGSATAAGSTASR